MSKWRRVYQIFTLFALLGQSGPAESIERRQVQTQSRPGFMVYPIIGRIPGVGDSYGAGLFWGNIGGSTVDFVGFGSTGNAKAAGLLLNEIPILADRLYFGVGYFDTSLPLRVYDRGMAGEGGEYHVAVVREAGGTFSSNLFLWERRIQVFGRIGDDRTTVLRILDKSGQSFRNSDSDPADTIYLRVGSRFDWTDDYWDPRQGIRLEAIRSELSVLNSNYSQAHSNNFSATGYLPVGNSSTWAFNYFRSKSYVTRNSPLSETDLRTALSLNCNEIGDLATRSSCQEVENRRVSERAAANAQGNATSLGGADRLRSFPTNRYRASDSMFYGSEFRWNLTDESTPFNFLFISGVRSNFQLAFFYEAGAVVDSPTQLIDVTPVESFGVGLRMIFSGMIGRLDVGWGREGSEVTLFVGYPWGLPVL